MAGHLSRGVIVITHQHDQPLQELEMPRLRQGYVEASNVVPMREMVRLIETMRHFEAGQRLLRSHDEMLERALGVLGEP